MAVFDFWKRRRLNNSIFRLKEDFNEEIRDFAHFKELQFKKIDIIKKIRKIWNERWKEAEGLTRENIPFLIRKQIMFVELNEKYIEDEDFILQHLIKTYGQENGIFKNDGRTLKIKEAIVENSAILKNKCILPLKENLTNQLQFLNKNDVWITINQNQQFLDILNSELELSKRIDGVIIDIINKVKSGGGFSSSQKTISRRGFFGYAGAGIISTFLLSGCTSKLVELSEMDIMGKSSGKEDIKINIRIFYGVHGTAEDALNFREWLQKADIYIPEKFGWDKDTLDAYRHISSGDETPEEFTTNEKGFVMQQLKMMYKSRKYILFIDVPKGHLIYKLSKNLKRPTIDYNRAFENLLSLHNEYFKEDAFFIKERENFMLHQLQSFIQKLKDSIKKNPKSFPNIKNKHKINILITLGAIHTQFSHYVYQEFPEGTSRKFQTMPLIMPLGAEITRRNIFRKNIPDGLLAADLFETMVFPILFDELLKISSDRQKLFIFLRNVAANFSFEEIKNIYETIQKQGLDKKKEILTSALSQKGIKLPQTPEEFTNMLPRYAR